MQDKAETAGLFPELVPCGDAPGQDDAFLRLAGRLTAALRGTGRALARALPGLPLFETGVVLAMLALAAA